MPVFCNEPDVAVTVMVEVVGAWVETGVELHPTSRLAPSAPAASSRSNFMPRRFLKPSKHSVSASVVTGTPRCPLLCSDAVIIGEAIVSTVVTA